MAERTQAPGSAADGPARDRPAPAPSPARLEGEATAVALRVALGQPPGAAPPSPAALAGQARRELEDAPAAAPSGDGGMRQQVGRALGRDFSGVRLHTGPEAAARTEAAGAHAAAQGGDVWFAPGRYRPDRPLGRALIAHELAHAAQHGAAPPLVADDALHDAAHDELRALTPAPAGTLSLFACGGGGGDKQEADKAAEQADTEAADATADAGPPPPPPRIARVEDVRSLYVEEDQGQVVKGGDEFLQKRLKQRMDAIEGELRTATAGSARAETLAKLKTKTLDQILAEPDTIISKAFRKDVIEAKAKYDAKVAKRDLAAKNFHRYDAFFNEAAVATALTGTGFTPADLKALIAQESHDLLREDKGEGIAGIAQLGPTEEAEAGGRPGDRKKPRKAVLLAAKILKIKSERLDKMLSPVPTGDEHRRFVVASYNAGEKTIADAQKLAIKMGRAGTTWNDLVAVGPGATPEEQRRGSPFWQSAKANLAAAKVDPDEKYVETVLQYVPRIELRLTAK